MAERDDEPLVGRVRGTHQNLLEPLRLVGPLRYKKPDLVETLLVKDDRASRAKELQLQRQPLAAPGAAACDPGSSPTRRLPSSAARPRCRTFRPLQASGAVGSGSGKACSSSPNTSLGEPDQRRVQAQRVDREIIQGAVAGAGLAAPGETAASESAI